MGFRSALRWCTEPGQNPGSPAPPVRRRRRRLPNPRMSRPSGEQPSRSDQRSESAQPSPAARPEAPNPPSEAPVPVASEKAASAPEPVRPTESYRSAGSSLNLDDLRLGLEQQSGSGWSKTSKRVIFGGAGLAIALVIGGLLLRSSFAGKQPVENAGGAHGRPRRGRRSEPDHECRRMGLLTGTAATPKVRRSPCSGPRSC